MEDNNQIPTFSEFENPEPQRPGSLTFLCIFSFINAVLQFISNIFTFMTYNTMIALSEDEDYLETMEKFGVDSEMSAMAFDNLLSVDRIYYLLTALLFVGSFVGVLYMWKMQKRGFHIYAIAQILIMIVAAMFTSVTGLNVVLTALFILAYYLLSKRYMKDVE
jgi:hypothetical protein